MTERRLKIRRPSGWLAFALAIITLAVGVGVFVRAVTPHRHRVSLMAGDPATTRALVGHLLVAALAKRGIDAHIVKAMAVETALAELNDGEIDLMLAPSALDLEDYPNLREATPLYLEALQLVVRHEMAAAVAEDLGALRGHTIDIGPAGSASARLADAVLGFAEVTDGGEAIVLRNLDPAALRAQLDARDHANLPDAFFVLSMVPSPPIVRLVREANYRLIPLAFADAFRLRGILTEGAGAGPLAIERSDIYETVIPPFVYETIPPVPATPLPTLGTRLLLLTNDQVPAATITAILEAIFTSPFARLSHPPLEDSVLGHPTRLTLHEGTQAYIARNQPFVTDERVDVLSNTMSIIGALGGSSLFLWQWRRRQTQRAREELFGNYLRRLADTSRRVADVELAADLQLEPLAAAQRQLLELKAEVLDGIIAGALGETEAVSALVMPITAATDHVAELILHVRENVEERAEAQGRSVEAVWTEALEGGDEAKGPPATE